MWRDREVLLDRHALGQFAQLYGARGGSLRDMSGPKPRKRTRALDSKSQGEDYGEFSNLYYGKFTEAQRPYVIVMYRGLAITVRASSS
jgi:hypothetical protein